jgi:hypothetical protein
MFPPEYLLHFFQGLYGRRKRKTLTYQLEFSTQSDNGYVGEFSNSGCLDGVNPYPTFFSMSTNALTSLFVPALKLFGDRASLREESSKRSILRPAQDEREK